MDIDLNKNFYYNFNGKLFKIDKDKTLFERGNIYFTNVMLEQDVIEYRKRSLESMLKSNKKVENVLFSFDNILNIFYIEFNNFKSLLYIRYLTIIFNIDIEAKKVKDIVLSFKTNEEVMKVIKIALEKIKSNYLSLKEDSNELIIKLRDFDYNILKENLNFHNIFLKIIDELTFGIRKGYGFSLVFYVYNHMDDNLFPNTTSINLIEEIKDEKVIKNFILRENFE